MAGHLFLLPEVETDGKIYCNGNGNFTIFGRVETPVLNSLKRTFVENGKPGAFLGFR
jgi:hypothetical protein